MGLGGTGRGPGNGGSVCQQQNGLCLCLVLRKEDSEPYLGVRQCYSSVALLSLISHASVFLPVKLNDPSRNENMCVQEAFC